MRRYAGTALLFVGLALYPLFADSPSRHSSEDNNPRTKEESQRSGILAVASKYVGAQEETGHNDGELIEDIIASAGFSRKSQIPYCGAFVRFVYDEAGFKRLGPQGKDSAYSPNWVSRPTWTMKRNGATPLPADTFGIYFASKQRVAHTGIVEDWSEVVLTIEANTSPQVKAGSAKDRDGDGIWRKRRSPRQIYSVRSWF